MEVNIEFFARNTRMAVLRGDVVVVMDVLRCSSSIIAALAQGATAIVPVKTVREAREVHQANPEFILAGEREGVKPLGFDYGNSPSVFFHAELESRSLILTTTSGTAALSEAKGAKYVLVGAFLNAKSVAESALKIAEKEKCGITLALSGKKGSFSLEDFLGAGAIQSSFPSSTHLSDAAQAALIAFHGAKNRLYDTIKNGNHAKYLINIGFGDDVEFCSQVDKFSIVPSLQDNKITPLNLK